ncbi:MAG TPA: hypothetical protein VG796_14000 [Verrucomicrobiales bacterium]|nr:hypothetical protein [Verrucomicrobiales bacterium]
MWKPLSIISGLLLLIAGGIMYTQVQYPLRSEKLQAKAANDNLALANANQVESKKARAQSDTDLADAKNELAANSQKKATALAAKEKKVAEVTETTAKKDAAAKELADLENKLKDLGGLARLVAELKELEAKKTTLDASIENTKGAIASTIAHREATDKVIAGLKLRDIYQRTGTIVESFKTFVSAVNPELGFVVLAHGNASNVTKGAKFDITRNGALIAKVTVTQLEQTRAIAEIVPGTLAAGETIMPGDRASVNVSSTPSSLAASVKKPDAKPAAKPGAADATKPAEPAAVDPFASPDGAAPPAEKPAPTPPAETPAPAPAPDASTPAPAPAPTGDAKPEMKPENK